MNATFYFMFFKYGFFPGDKNREEGKKDCDGDEENDEGSPKGVLETPPFSGSIKCSSCGSQKNDNIYGISESSSPPQEKAMVPSKVGGAFAMAMGAMGISGDNHGLVWKNLVGQMKKKSVKKTPTIPFLGGYEFSKKRLVKKSRRNKSAAETIDCGELIDPKPFWRNFTFQELVDATDNFSPDKLVGEGGHAKVYKGCLPNGQIVAVKKITKTEKTDDDRINDYLSELGIIAHINHPNANRLIGFGTDGGLHLVFLFAQHGSLATFLHDEGKSLDWKTRYKVAVGVAEGLEFLHYECHRRIVHRDITSSNILLTEDYEPQISDFGLSKWLPEKLAHHVVSPIEGTFGYMAPEYFMHGIVHEKTDVFSFGVLLLELITGQRAVCSDGQSLAMWAKPYLEKNNAKEIADPRIADTYDKVEMKRVMFTASLCIHHLPNMRPTMTKVVQFLKGENEQDMKTNSTGARSLFGNSCDLEDYTSTSYLNNINRHMQLIME
ncbi:hypothetical protein LIER_06606 [Lithospermum erythrorhizon]|uniref:non-specific serine/threonine protein kinase n=1 Tax=Lithospermum erythrorhizon TaxID=34254 RepID=A0AAV3P9G8_LITER